VVNERVFVRSSRLMLIPTNPLCARPFLTDVET
jgi:hypothetical protein